jgi:hypothetical protein
MTELMAHPAVFVVIGAMGLFALVLGGCSVFDALHDR